MSTIAFHHGFAPGSAENTRRRVRAVVGAASGSLVELSLLTSLTMLQKRPSRLQGSGQE